MPTKKRQKRKKIKQEEGKKRGARTPARSVWKRTEKEEGVFNQGNRDQENPQKKRKAKERG